MDPQGTLEVVAEISIAVTGFAGIVGALARGRLIPANPSVWLGFWAMIETGFGTLFAALFPMLPHHLGLSDRMVWATSSAFIVLLLVCHAIFMAPHFLRAMRNLSWVRLPPLEIPLRSAFGLTLLSQLLNTVGIGLPQSAGGFLIGLYLLLLMAALNFVYLLYVLLRPEDEPPAA